MGFTGHRPFRGFTFILLAGVLGAALVGLTQCRLVNDTVTGVDLKSGSEFNGRSACVHECNDEFKKCKREEDARHKASKTECKALENIAERTACQRDEQRRHVEAHLGCVRAKNACKKGCYNEGGGSSN